MVLRAGEGQRRVSIETKVESRAEGSVVSTYQHQMYAYARIVSGSGNERIEAGKVASSVVHEVQFRWSSVLASTLKPSARIVDGSFVLEVEAVVDPGRHKVELLATCRETA